MTPYVFRRLRFSRDHAAKRADLNFNTSSHTSVHSCAACTSMFGPASSPKRSMPAGNRISLGERRPFRADSSGLIRCWTPRKTASKMTRWSVRAWSTEF